MFDLFYSYNEYLKKKYGAKTYTLPINIPTTCPNRDGTIGNGGCHFCSYKGTGFEYSDSTIDISKQMNDSRIRMTKRYKAEKFIAYFQNYTTTYLEIEAFKKYMNLAAKEDIVGIDISTRPDTLSEEMLNWLSEFSIQKKLDISFDMGLQIANDKILKDINRGHTVDDYIKAVKKLHSYNFGVCTHLILNLPETDIKDIENTVNIINKVHSDVVKLHSLYVAYDSYFGELYQKGELSVGTFQEYVDRAVYFICRLDPSIALSRIVSRVPKDDGLFSNWGMSWWKVYNEILNTLKVEKKYQGILFE